MIKFTIAFQLCCCLVVGLYSFHCTRQVKQEKMKALEKFVEIVLQEIERFSEAHSAYWIYHDDEILGLTCECSNCHIETCGDTPFCPHCGKRMKKGETIHEVEGEQKQ